MTILCRISIKLIIHLDDKLLLGHSLDEILMRPDTVILLMQHLGFIVTWKKSVFAAVQEIEILVLTIISVTL